ncbi:MAG: AlbA family DNA-binding domain-containing protein [Phyllobacterium sp.]
MSIERTNFDDISEVDLNDLIQAARPEGLAIDYKRDPYGNRDADKKEALKDITSFANSAGGHLIIGMKETKGVPTGLTGLPGVNPDAEICRLESLVRDGIEPRILGVRMRAVGLRDGGAALVIRIPRSWNPPHRVSSAGTNRFYVRNSGGAHEASVEELRVLFTLAADAQQRIKTFRSERIAAIVADQGPVLLAADGRLFVHLVPLSAFGQANQIDLERAFRAHARYRPIALTDVTRRYNLDGFINAGFVSGGEECLGYTQVFRNGIVEATRADLISDRAGMTFCHPGIREIAEVLPSYFEGLRELDVPAPIVVMISYEGVAGARLGIELDPLSDASEMEPLPPADPLLLPEVIVDDYGSRGDYLRALSPIFDALWNAAGFARCSLYDAERNWRRAD